MRLQPLPLQQRLQKSLPACQCQLPLRPTQHLWQPVLSGRVTSKDHTSRIVVPRSGQFLRHDTTSNYEFLGKLSCIHVRYSLGALSMPAELDRYTQTALLDDDVVATHANGFRNHFTGNVLAHFGFRHLLVYPLREATSSTTAIADSSEEAMVMLG
jgi:hypothetical protein